MGLDGIIHFGMSVVRLILLTVTMPSIPNDIDKKILLELLFICNCYLHNAVQQIWLVSINVNDRCTNNFSNLCAVIRRSALVWWRRKSKLIVHHYVNHSTCRIIYQTLELKRFIHTSLPSDSCISMNQYTHSFCSGIIL